MRTNPEIWVSVDKYCVVVMVTMSVYSITGSVLQHFHLNLLHLFYSTTFICPSYCYYIYIYIVIVTFLRLRFYVGATVRHLVAENIWQVTFKARGGRGRVSNQSHFPTVSFRFYLHDLWKYSWAVMSYLFFSWTVSSLERLNDNIFKWQKLHFAPNRQTQNWISCCISVSAGAGFFSCPFLFPGGCWESILINK